MYRPRDPAQLTPMARSLALSGLLAVGEVYSVAELARINSVMSPLFAARSAQARAYVRPDDMVTEGILDTVLSRRMRDLIFNLLPDPVLYHFHAYEIAGGSDKPHIFGDTLGGWHRDQDSELYQHSPTHISIFVYLGDVGADNGPFEFCPDPPQPGLRCDSPVISMTGHAGASFVWQRGFYHRAAPNHSPRRRRLIKLSLQPNAFRSPHLQADYFKNAIRAIPAGDPELDLLFGRYQGKQAPQIEPRRALQFAALAPQRTLGIADEVLRKARLREKNTPDQAVAYD
jgi:hypothetical protein